MINKAIIVGNLGSDPEMRSTQTGTTVATFSVATSEKWKDQTGNPQESTEWHRIVAFGKLGGICGDLLRKGSQVYIEGKIQTRKWQDQNGNDRYTTEIVVREMKILGSRQERQGGNDPESQGRRENYQRQNPGNYGQTGSMGEDVPF